MICEKCNKEHDASYGSGRFCSQKCARGYSTQAKRQLINEKVSATLAEKKQDEANFSKREETIKLVIADTGYVFSENPLACSLCNKILKNYQGLQTHLGVHNKTHALTVKRLSNKYKVKGTVLDVTNEEIENYREKHSGCEICGKTISHTTIINGEQVSCRLCVDHDHETGKFRGLLCTRCNRGIGWIEQCQDNINKYLAK